MTKLKKISNYFILISLSGAFVLLSSCLSIKPQATKSGKKLYETFFVGEEGTQYFIKPLSFESDEANSTLVIDFTFRYKDQVKDSAIVNLSILNSKLIKRVEKLVLKSAQTQINCNDITLLFNEANKDIFTNRMSTKIALSELRSFFSSSDWKINVAQNEGTAVYQGGKKTSKALKILNDQVFVLMN